MRRRLSPFARRSVLPWVVLLWLTGGLAQAESPEKLAQAAAEMWLDSMDAGRYAQGWQEASNYFQGAVTEQAWITALNGVRSPLGQLISRKFQRAQYADSLPGAPDGRYVVMQFDSRFENKAAAVETVTFMQGEDGSWKAAGYYIK